MPQVAESEAQETQTPLLEAVRTLGSENQRAVLSYALFLKQQEEETTRRIEADEAEWDKLFSNPEKMANFTRWAEQSLGEDPPELLDETRL